MSYLNKNNVVSRVYSNFRGADFRGEEINLVRSPDCLNVWKDYKHTESIRTRPEMKLDTGTSDKVWGVFFYDDEMIIHAGDTLYKSVDGVITVLFKGVSQNMSNSFIYDDVWYFKDGENYLQYGLFDDSSDVKTIRAVEAYVPTTTIARKPMGGGTRYEDVNMLSDYRKNSFLADGIAFSFFLDVTNIDDDYVPEVTVLKKKIYYSVTYSYAEDDTEHKNPIYTKTDTELNLSYDDVESMDAFSKTTTGEAVYCYNHNAGLFCCVGYKDTVISSSEYTVNYAEGSIIFKNTAPDEPLTVGQDNVVIRFKKAEPKYREAILKCNLLQVFDNRVFFSGNSAYPNMIWHCSLNDPSYVSDLDYYKEGMDDSAVKGMVAGNNALWVFREPSEANTTVFYHTPSLDEEYGKVYPSVHSSITTGCVGKAINFNDDIVFFSERGMEGISGDVTTEQVVSHRSSLVDCRMTVEAGYKDMILAEWQGYLLVFIKNKVYLADSRAMFQNENHYEYEWFYWELGKEVVCASVNKGILYIGTDSGVYTLTDTEADVVSYWVTALDKFKHPHKLKTTNKRGCVAEATGDVSVYAKLEDTGFEHIGTYKDVEDYFVCRIKRKKFKDIQLKFHSNTRFSLETITLECFIGGYIKR